MHQAARRVIVRDFYEDTPGRPCITRRAPTDLDETPAGNRRNTLWDDEMADGPSSFLGGGLRKATAELALGC